LLAKVRKRQLSGKNKEKKKGGGGSGQREVSKKEKIGRKALGVE